MMNQYQKGISVMDFLERLKINYETIGDAIDDQNLEKSYQMITENPNITKAEFLKAMKITEYPD